MRYLWLAFIYYSILLNMVYLRDYNVSINTQRLTIRTLNADDDFTLYLNWMRNLNNVFIESTNTNYKLTDIQNYVEEKNKSENAILLGFFDIFTNKHVGNIKYEPIIPEKKLAVMGILIGEVDYRGIGIAKEVIINTFEKVMVNLGIEKIILGVRLENSAAINSYYKCGFIINKESFLDLDSNSVEMILNHSKDPI